MSAIDRKLAEHLGYLVLENIKLQAMVEDAKALVAKAQQEKARIEAKARAQGLLLEDPE